MAPPFVPPLANALPYIEPSLKRVRVLFAGITLVDTTHTRLVWERPNYPHYFFHTPDLPKQYLRPSQTLTTSLHLNPTISDIVVGERTAHKAVASYTSGPLEGLSKVVFGAVDAWFEEDERIFVHPKDPYKRVDVLSSSRHVRVEVDGVVVAETRRPRLLFETSLRVRTYIPLVDCRQDLLVPSETSSECPYKVRHLKLGWDSER